MTYNDLKIVLKVRLLVENFNLEHLDKYELHIKLLYQFLENNFILDEISPQYIKPHIDLLADYIMRLEKGKVPIYSKSAS